MRGEQLDLPPSHQVIRDLPFSANVAAIHCELVAESISEMVGPDIFLSGAREMADARTHHSNVSRAAKESCESTATSRDSVVLLCTALQFISVAARSTGSLFDSHPRLLPSILAPLLDKLGDSDARVRLPLVRGDPL